MSRIPINQYYINMAFLAAQRSGCIDRHVGCVITDINNRVLSIGYNSPPRKLPECQVIPCGGHLPGYSCIAAHAEISAITACRAIQEAHNIYVTLSPCVLCTQAIMATNIQNLYFGEFHKTWPESREIWTGHWEHVSYEIFNSNENL